MPNRSVGWRIVIREIHGLYHVTYYDPDNNRVAEELGFRSLASAKRYAKNISKLIDMTYPKIEIRREGVDNA